MPSRRLLAVLAWAGVIFALSSLSHPPGEQGAWWPPILAHFTEYLILAFLLVRLLIVALPGKPLGSVLLLAWLIAVLYAFSDEWHQSFVPGRDPSLFDVATDALGAAAGCALFAVFTARGRRTSAQ